MFLYRLDRLDLWELRDFFFIFLSFFVGFVLIFKIIMLVNKLFFFEGFDEFISLSIWILLLGLFFLLFLYLLIIENFIKFVLFFMIILVII